MTTLQQLLDQQAAIARQIDDLKTQSKAQAIAEVRALMAAHGLTAADLAVAPPRKGAAKKVGTKVAAKYRDTATGATWSGRGLKPKWLTKALAQGKSIADFAV
jgi:DNA-binding protein H-NS